ncbi:MAG: 5-(carboxyamino)imidazole ribonucleotide synthase [Pseudomonadota bacterium]
MSLPIGATIGILGGGQLGRMLAMAAAKLGFKTLVFAPGENLPAAQVSNRHMNAAYDDVLALQAFAGACDVVTLEWENVPVSAVETIEAVGTRVRPGAGALSVAQDRVEEKVFLERCGIDCAPWRAVDTVSDLHDALAEMGPDAILKTRRDGYDGKGQVRLHGDTDALSAWNELAGASAILEGFVPFNMEISVVLARDPIGQVVTYTPPHNTHARGILRHCSVPAPIPETVARDAQRLATKLADALDYVGVLALEMFVMPDGSLLANEFAPRVHNSGHWTPEACETGQFENHIRAVAGWPLGASTLLYAVEMENLIGADAAESAQAMLARGSVTLYGKEEIRPGRKMGHIVRKTG